MQPARRKTYIVLAPSKNAAPFGKTSSLRQKPLPSKNAAPFDKRCSLRQTPLPSTNAAPFDKLRSLRQTPLPSTNSAPFDKNRSLRQKPLEDFLGFYTPGFMMPPLARLEGTQASARIGLLGPTSWGSHPRLYDAAACA